MTLFFSPSSRPPTRPLHRQPWEHRAEACQVGLSLNSQTATLWCTVLFLMSLAILLARLIIVKALEKFSKLVITPSRNKWPREKFAEFPSFLASRPAFMGVYLKPTSWILRHNLWDRHRITYPPT
ncbi:hypothetical protein NOF04DRAFT_5943 [Fusarium oxysporum II5]|uniref:Uncharacterized protein n=2 Tax=Fusarium oxysporum species complex TaxID=171631 RepID=X0JPQ1_FUSO5|nr:uncharacterized protein FOIG_09198 [Fusarium odoratissimum NRRL 54006]EXL98391.1 hypothetical protein FOIG_09198 [Fusarium odoratissimum NRRL 54006]KAK2129461.1 hypothetical protein NOF04DRAFT_5943 [Fusarium oxysporum II5]TXC02013.1 hypothetical protein FocTR4_00008303 [Fusarium oxysporum f. sp. cubense]